MLKAYSIRSLEVLGSPRSLVNIKNFEIARQKLYAVRADEMPNSTKAELIHLFDQLDGTERGGVTQAELFELTAQSEVQGLDLDPRRRLNVFEFALTIFPRLEGML